MSADHADPAVRQATSSDAQAIGRLLDDLNTEFGEPSPGHERLAERIRELFAAGDVAVLLGGAGPDGVAVLRFRPSSWTQALECYLAELYVVPGRRRDGVGRALMKRTIEVARQAGADHIDLGAGENDVAARALYESLCFTNRDGNDDGPLNLYYERDI